MEWESDSRHSWPSSCSAHPWPRAPRAEPSAPSSAPATSAPASVAPSESAAAEVACDKFTILNHRTDLAENGDWDKLYVQPFKAKYPGIKEISVQSIRDYHTDVRTRMNTPQYGDVLVIPNGVTASEYVNFFEPLGSVADLKTKYRFIEESGNFEGTVYGIAISGNRNGLLYNKKVFAAAGITDWPKTTDEFLAALKAIKDKVPGVDPLYTNYAAGWPMSQWQPYAPIAVADPDFSAKEAHHAAPWAAGKGQFIVDKLLYDVVQTGPEPEGSDDYGLGALQAARRAGQDRRHAARLLGDQPDAGRGKDGGRRPGGHRLHAVPQPGRR